MEEDGWDIYFSLFVCSCVHREGRGRGPFLAAKLHQLPGMGDGPFITDPKVEKNVPRVFS